MKANEAERRRWNDEGWAASWPRREPLTSAVTPLLLHHLALSPGAAVLDVGSGGGAAACEAAVHAGAGRVVGADISVPLVGLARRRAAEAGLSQVTFVVADVQCDEIDGAPFDAAMSQFGVMFFDEPVRAFANLRRHLVPGGRLAFACWQALERNPWFVGAALAPFVAPAPPLAPGKTPTGPFALADARATGVLLGAAGWEQVERHPYEMVVPVDRHVLYEETDLALLGVADGEQAAARAAVNEFLRRFQREDGRVDAPLSLQIFTAVAGRL